MGYQEGRRSCFNVRPFGWGPLLRKGKRVLVLNKNITTHPSREFTVQQYHTVTDSAEAGVLGFSLDRSDVALMAPPGPAVGADYWSVLHAAGNRIHKAEGSRLFNGVITLRVVMAVRGDISLQV